MPKLTLSQNIFNARQLSCTDPAIVIAIQYMMRCHGGLEPTSSFAAFPMIVSKHLHCRCTEHMWQFDSISSTETAVAITVRHSVHDDALVDWNTYLPLLLHYQ